MTKQNINAIVIGANYGDEGKGRCTRYILRNCLNYGKIESKDDAVVIKHNGGSQAGHTSEGFVYHAYGSADTETYLAPKFIVNPRAILSEMTALTIKREMIPRTMYISECCRVSTPIDILCNQLIETVRGDKKHGSCGMGIYATITRSKTVNTTVRTLMDREARGDIVSKILYYYQGFVDAIRFIPEQFQDLDLRRMMMDFFDEFDELVENPGIEILPLHKEESFLKSKKLRIFETGQGLLLDKDCEESFPHVTPSHTNHINPVEIIKRCHLYEDGTVTPVYCTRPYITKHGAGELKDENVNCEEVLKVIKYDTTNVKNEWQGSIRVAPIDEHLGGRINRNIMVLGDAIPGGIDFPLIFISWMDLFNGFVMKDGIKPFGDMFLASHILNCSELVRGCSDSHIKRRSLDERM